MRRRVALVVLIVAALALTPVALRLLRGDEPIPDVRGNLPIGDSYSDTRWVKPLLDAGFCVAFRYDAGSSEVTGHGEEVFDSYLIGDESLNGSTVTVVVRGSPLGGASVDWNSMPVLCPSSA